MSRGPGELLVAEMFGPTFQGEGPSTGRPAVFVRLSGCNLSCSWCDTPYTWDSARFDLRSERRRLSVDAVAEGALAVAAPLVVVTGGEPLLQADALTSLIGLCRAAGREVEVETNGTLAPPTALLGLGVRWNVSPKLANSGVPLERRIRSEALLSLAASGAAVFKFVVSSEADLDEISELERTFGLAPVWVMPEGQTSTQVVESMRRLSDGVIARGWSLTSRLHVLLWEAERGR